MSYGRRRIFTDETEISTENVIAEVEAAFLVHSDNRTEVEKLYQYYRNAINIEAERGCSIGILLAMNSMKCLALLH